MIGRESHVQGEGASAGTTGRENDDDDGDDAVEAWLLGDLK